MKRLILAILIVLFAVNVQAASRKSFKIPLATGINTWTPRHLLSDNFTPWALNCQFQRGIIKKRPGISLVEAFDSAILGMYRGSSNSLIATQDGFFDWNNVAEPTDAEYAMTAITNTAFTGIDQDAEWQFIRHFDSNMAGTDQKGEIVAVNGVDAALRWDQNASDVSLRAIGPLEISGEGPRITGRVAISDRGALILGNIKDLSTVPSGTETNFPFRVSQSTTDNGLNFSNNLFEQRPERGDQITGLYHYEDQVILFKETSIWRLVFPLFTESISWQEGLTSFGGATASETVYFNSNRKIFTLSDILSRNDKTWLSMPVHSLLASENPGSGDIRIVEDVYGNVIRVSTGRKLFLYDKWQDGWQMWEYDNEISILADIDPYNRTIRDYIGVFGLHTVFTVAEEDIMPDFLISYKTGTTKNVLYQQNHFGFDEYTEGVTKAIKMQYDTPYMAFEAPRNIKRLLSIQVQATPGSLIRFYTASDNYPRRQDLDWTDQGTCTVDSQGFCDKDVDVKAIWHTVRIEHESKDNFELSDLEFEYELREEIR